MQHINKIIYICCFLAAPLFITEVWAANKQLVIGAGPSTKVVTLFFKQLSTQPGAAGFNFVIPPKSAKHAGGIRASNKYLFGRTGRPLNTKETAQNKEEIFLASIPIAFVTGQEAGIKSISLQQINDVFTKKKKNWKAIGGNDLAITVVGREATEALFTSLKKQHPFFKDVTFDRIFKKDHQVVNYIKSGDGKGAIGFGAKPNFSDSQILTVEGFASGLNVGLVYDVKNRDHAIVKLAKEFAASAEWQKQLVGLGMLAPQ